MLYDESLVLLRKLYATDRLETTVAVSSTKQAIEAEAARIALLPDRDKGMIALAPFAMACRSGGANIESD
jgi:hypothetical protein